jgi:hypothetical protein
MRVYQAPSAKAAMMEPDERLSILEQKVDSWLLLDARLKAVEDSVKKINPNPKSSLKDWIQTLSPLVTALVIFGIGFVLKDSVTQALARETLDLTYVTNVRDLIKGFDTAQEQTTADSNAIALAMYGKVAIVPLIERLQGGDVAQLAAERGLRIIGDSSPAAACAAFIRILRDPARQYSWQTHEAVIRLVGFSECVPYMSVLEQYLVDARAVTDPERLTSFTHRFSNANAFDRSNIDELRQYVEDALVILNASRERANAGEKPWWK